MASSQRRKNGSRNKRPNLTYFFLNDQLHKKLAIHYGKDLIVCWNYPEGCRKKYTYTDTLKRHGLAFTTREVCFMLNRGRLTLERALQSGMIERPQFTYRLDENRNMGQYMWSEKDIFAMHEYLSTVHRGRPRNDGLVIPAELPTPRELRAMVRDKAYVKALMNGEEYRPAFRVIESGEK